MELAVQARLLYLEVYLDGDASLSFQLHRVHCSSYIVLPSHLFIGNASFIRTYQLLYRPKRFASIHID